MIDNLEAYKIWAPEGARWTDWAKPVLFAGGYRAGSAPLRDIALDIPVPGRPLAPGTPENHPGFAQVASGLRPASGTEADTMIVVDLPGRAGIAAGLALARLGFRPVPLYNGVFPPPGKGGMAVDVADIAAALFSGAEALRGIQLQMHAPPVFLLDARRMEGAEKSPGTYDNRWCVFPQDMPSAAFLLRHRVMRVLVRTGRIQDDLSHILYRYQEQGIAVHHWNDSGVKEIAIPKPAKFGNLRYRILAIAGLTRNAAGGFGGIVPEPHQGGSG